MSEELSLLSSWIYSVLSADSSGAGSLGVLSSGITSRIYDSLIDQDDSVTPWIVFQMLSPGNDFATNAARRLYANPLYIVKVVSKDQAFSQMSAIASRVDSLLHRKADQLITGGRIISCIRERPHKMIEPGGIVYRHLGGEYRIMVAAE